MMLNKTKIEKGKVLKVKKSHSKGIALTKGQGNITSNAANKKLLSDKPYVQKDVQIERNDRKPDEESFGASKMNVKRKYKKDKQKFKGGAANNNEDKSESSHKLPSQMNSLFNEAPKELHVNTRTGKSLSENVFTTSGNKFSDLQIHRHLVSNLAKINFTTLTTVQEKAIPVILTGQDVLIRSQTGSGKTLSYAVPIVDALQGIAPRLKRNDGVQAIVVVPTRELALQTIELFNKINTFQWIVCSHLCGGENRQSEKKRIKKGLHVLIGTPGRLLDHVLHTTSLKMENVRCLILDEADRLLDMGFRKDIISLVEALSNAKLNSEYNPLQILKSSQNNATPEELPQPTTTSEFSLRDVNSKNRQTILLSATLTEGVSELANFAMKNHVFIDAFDSDVNMSDNLIIPNTVKQEFILTYVKHRLFTLSALVAAQAKKRSKMFVFMASTQMVNYHYDLFTECLVKMPVNRGKLKTGNVVLYDVDLSNSDDDEEEEEIVLDTQIFKLHGNMNHAMRKEVFNSFRAAKTGVLLCTDVAARGIDVPSADCIIQYTGPQTNEDYLHRVGRTGRAGQHGSAIIFLTHEEQEYISRLAEHGVYLKQRSTDDLLQHLCKIMQEPDHERAAEALQRRYETAVSKNKSLHNSACMGYSTWSRFYNSYPVKMREIFDFKNVNLGHYATSFALRDTPSQISQVVRNQVDKMEDPKLNTKLANHSKVDQLEGSKVKRKEKPKKRPHTLITSEYASGLEPVKKRKKEIDDDDDD